MDLTATVTLESCFETMFSTIWKQDDIGVVGCGWYFQKRGQRGSRKKRDLTLWGRCGDGRTNETDPPSGPSNGFGVRFGTRDGFVSPKLSLG